MFALVLAACSSEVPATSHVFDPCQPIDIAVIDATDAQQQSVGDALARWRARGVAAFQIGDGAGVQVVFTSGNPAVYGYYDEAAATVYVNAELADPAARAVTIAHELGHALGLAHVPADQRASVMNPGNLTIDPTDADVAAIRARWGACPAP